MAYDFSVSGQHYLFNVQTFAHTVLALGGESREEALFSRYCTLAAIGTIADVMRMEGENRTIAFCGLEALPHTDFVGIHALLKEAGLLGKPITSIQIGFVLSPRINAAGRMGSTDVAFDLLLTDDPAEAAILAGKLEEINTERRNIESALTEAAMAKVEKTYQGGRCVVVGGEGWNEGVKGIVTSRIVNRYHVPAILFTIQDGIARGSGRSVGEVDLFHAVEQCSDVLVRFGGHAGAVGVTCEASRLDEFRERLEAALANLPAEQFRDTGEVTATVGLSELTVESIGALEMLQPFGQGNKKPLLASVGVTMRNRSRVGADGAHRGNP
ncbi:MAG: single-stranded-DNA-specific exonuclease RecJ, partial [Coriobacteriaceae bacterium]|nr:single-stranded-DNA-specific exonuclease RecJ [Coriobacteriaceae bacterium]